MVEEHERHGERHVVVSVLAEVRVPEEEEDVGDHVGDAGVHPDLVEHLAHNPAHNNGRYQLPCHIDNTY